MLVCMKWSHDFLSAGYLLGGSNDNDPPNDPIPPNPSAFPLAFPLKPGRAAHTNSPSHVQHLFQHDALRVRMQRQPPA